MKIDKRIEFDAIFIIEQRRSIRDNEVTMDCPLVRVL